MTMGFGDILENSSALVTNLVSTFSALATGFGIFLFLPVIFRSTGKVIGYIKGILGFSSKRGRR